MPHKPMKKNEFYCVSCRSRVSVPADQISLVYYNNEKRGQVPALKSKCPKSGTNLTKFISEKTANKMK